MAILVLNGNVLVQALPKIRGSLGGTWQQASPSGLTSRAVGMGLAGNAAQQV
jgi:hypothetical protein